MYKIRWTRLQAEIFRLFCIKSGSIFNQRHIAKLLNVSPTAVGNSLEILEKEKVILVKKQGETNLSLIELNRDNSRVIFLKRAENFKMIYESGFPEFIYNSFPGATIILFGSYSRGEDVLESDIDIAIVGVNEEDLKLEKFEKVLERKININFYSNWKLIPKTLKNNILNGILLSGGVNL